MSAVEKPEPTGESSKPALHERAERAKEMLEAGGLEIAGVGVYLLLWRKLGLKGVLLLVLVVGLPTGQYSAFRYAVYSALPRMVGGFGLQFKAEEWSLSPFTMRATARHVLVSRPNDHPVLTADEIEFQGSLWTILRGLPDMLTFHVFGGTQPFNEIVVRHGELHLERSLTGRLNWSDFVDAVPQARFEEAIAGVYRINELRLEDCRVTYVENVSGGSGDGVIRTAQVQVKVDEVTGTIADLAPPAQPDERPTRFKINGRSADGVFEVSGSAALFFPGSRTASNESIQRVSLTPGQTAYPYEISVYLENIAAGAYGRMVPVNTIIPVNGTIAGTTTLVHTGNTLECRGSFTMTGVRFAPNPLVIAKPAQVELVRRMVADTVYTGPFVLCDTQGIGAGREAKPVPPAATLLTSLTRQATVESSPSVKALVDRDRRVLGGESVETTIDSLTANYLREAGQRIGLAVGGRTGQVVGASLAAQGASPDGSGGKGAGHAVTGGVKAVGSGFKRLFGGGSKSNDSKAGK